MAKKKLDEKDSIGEYNASSILNVDQHTHLLKRLSLTFGDPEQPGTPFSAQKNVAIREVLDNSLDEIRAGYGTHLKLTFFKDRSYQIEDSGRGIPVDAGVDAQGNPASGIFLALGLIQSGGKFQTDSKRFSSGLNGVGASSSNHTSKRFDVTVYRNNKKYELQFQDGTPGFFDKENDPDAKFTPITDLTEVRVSKDDRPAKTKANFKTGTTIRAWIRDEVFSSTNPYDDQDIIARLKRTAFLVPELHAEVVNELHEIDGKPQHEFFNFPNGVEDLVPLIQPDEAITPLIHLKLEGSYIEKNVAVLQRDGSVRPEDLERIVPIELAFRYGDKYETTVNSFVNTIYTKLGGVHNTGLEKAFVSAFNDKFTSMRGLLTKKDDPPISDDYLEGLTAVLSVQVAEPVFSSQSKEGLRGKEVQKAIQDAITQGLTEWMKVGKNKETLETIAKKVTNAAKNRQRVREQKEINRKKNEISASALPVKLVDCELAGTDAAELYICEGDSAVSSLKAARDGRINALLGIRGKIINAHKEQAKRVLANTEVQDIIKTLGAGFGKDFDIEKIRYGRIFIAVDADPDGNAIATLLYALFWHQFKDVLHENRLYKIETPLFVVSTHKGQKSEKHYARDERERDRIINKLEKQGTKYSVTRLKGLGEVMADTLEETAINPETRIITQVTMDDVEAAAASLDLILGTDTAPRKKWIEESEVNEEELGE